MKAIPTMLLVLFALNAAAQTRPETHTVEILSAELTNWTTTSSDTSTNCTTQEPLPGSLPGTGPTVNCDTSGPRTIPHMQVKIVVKMPDGNEVKAECHSAPCSKPSLGPHQAKIDKHCVYLPSTAQGKPEYNKDGTIKKPGKVQVFWVKFSFE
jgi:hypothetical protein